ncbi:MAL-like protein isoform X3 [Antennarius striatus]|uniref:MAL-like protein isoform X3 n=1 Tax=Antennarius striatus TaxID=241820 RepID=UPI0035AEA9AF
MASNTPTMPSLPSGVGICVTVPDFLFLPELVFGGLVWILVACTLVAPQNPQGWVMFVSVFCFLMTFIWMLVFACGGHQNHSSWAAACFGVVGQSHSGPGGRNLQELPAGHRCSGVLLRGDAPLLHPLHPVSHPMEDLLTDATGSSIINHPGRKRPIYN